MIEKENIAGVSVVGAEKVGKCGVFLIVVISGFNANNLMVGRGHVRDGDGFVGVFGGVDKDGSVVVDVVDCDADATAGSWVGRVE